MTADPIAPASATQACRPGARALTDLEELESFAVLHARAQGVRPATVRRVLARIGHDGDGPGSWVAEWSAEAQRARARGHNLQAAARFSLARFPYVDGPVRRAALAQSVACFERWRSTQRATVKRTLERPGGTFSYYGADLEHSGRPLLVVIGGIVSTKEQWGRLLRLGGRIKMRIAIAEMPSVGENTLPYTPSSCAQLSAILDDLGEKPNDRAFVLGLSFGGHLAMQCALQDPRIGGIATIGAPISAFFSDAQWWTRVPRVTRRTLAHATGVAEADLTRALPAWALDAAALRTIRIPVAYVASARDEIIPAADVALLERHASGVRTICFDDVHGSPQHLLETRLWLTRSLLRMRGAAGPWTGALSALLRLRLRLRGMTA